MVGEGCTERVVRELPVEAGDVAGDASVVLEAALGGAARAVTAQLCDADTPGPAQARRLHKQIVLIKGTVLSSHLRLILSAIKYWKPGKFFK